MICSRVLRLTVPLAGLPLLARCTSFSSRTGAAAGPPSPAGTTVYFAESGTVTGTHDYRPACAKGCLLSGDSTAAMWNMTWQSWNATEAAGSGTEKIDDCTPNCASGTVHAVAVRVTFSRPVTAKCAGASARYWTRVSFSWPRGLPSALSGGGGPVHPLVYSALAGGAGCA